MRLTDAVPSAQVVDERLKRNPSDEDYRNPSKDVGVAVDDGFKRQHDRTSGNHHTSNRPGQHDEPRFLARPRIHTRLDGSINIIAILAETFTDSPESREAGRTRDIGFDRTVIGLQIVDSPGKFRLMTDFSVNEIGFVSSFCCMRSHAKGRQAVFKLGRMGKFRGDMATTIIVKLPFVGRFQTVDEKRP